MTGFVCPVCREELERSGGSLYCKNRHCYDISRRGYVNLLMSQASSDSRHGDSREMVAARRDFLGLGLYDPLCDAVIEAIKSRDPKNGMYVLDVGCGECYYTSKVAAALKDYDPVVCGIDISKEALSSGAGRDKCLNLAVASAYDIPVADGRADVILNLFAPHKESEFSRILKPGGLLIRAFPHKKHLWELKCAIYDEPYENDVGSIDIDKFKCVDFKRIAYEIELKTNKDIRNLFSMTPYSYKTSADDEKKIESLDHLATRVEFALAIYIKE